MTSGTWLVLSSEPSGKTEVCGRAVCIFYFEDGCIHSAVSIEEGKVEVTC